VHAAQDGLDAALAAHQAIPARLPLAQVNPGQQMLDTETKLIHHAIRIAAYNWRASNFPDCGPNKVRSGKDEGNWPENTRNTRPSFVTRLRSS